MPDSISYLVLFEKIVIPSSSFPAPHTYFDGWLHIYDIHLQVNLFFYPNVDGRLNVRLLGAVHCLLATIDGQISAIPILIGTHELMDRAKMIPMLRCIKKSSDWTCQSLKVYSDSQLPVTQVR